MNLISSPDKDLDSYLDDEMKNVDKKTDERFHKMSNVRQSY